MYPQASYFPQAPMTFPGPGGGGSLTGPGMQNSVGFPLPGGGGIGFTPPGADSFQTQSAAGAQGALGGGEPSQAEIDQLLAQLMSSMGGGDPGAMPGMPGMPGAPGGAPSGSGSMQQMPDGSVYEMSNGSGGGLLSSLGNLLKPRNLLILGGTAALAIFAGPKIYKRLFGGKNPVEAIKRNVEILSQTPENLAKELSDADGYLGKVTSRIGKPDELTQLRTATTGGFERLKSVSPGSIGLTDTAQDQLAKSVDEAAGGFSKLLDEAGKLKEGESLADDVVTAFKGVVDDLKKVINPDKP